MPHDLTTKYYVVKCTPINFLIRKYKVARASIYRWVKLFNIHENSLIPKSHRPLSPHPNAHYQTEIKWIADCCRRNPNFGPLEIYSRLLIQKPYSRSYYGFYRCFKRINKHFLHKEFKPKEKAPFIIHLTELATRCN